MKPSDADLVGAARGGDATSFGMLLERHRARLHAIALSMLGHGPQAEDAVHDAFMVALRRLEDLRDPDAAGAWLCAIVRNLCLTRLRERAPGALIESERAAPGPSPEQIVEEMALRDWVWTALDALSEPLRLTAILRFFSRTSSYEEIALICGVPVGTVRSRLNQARLKLGGALLESAASAHRDAAALADHRRRHFTDAFDEYNSGVGCDLYLAACTGDVEIGGAGEPVLPRGYEAVARILEEDIAAGVNFSVDEVIASPDITILEGSFINPPSDPFHCPPKTTQVYRHDGEGIRSIRMHFGSRPR